MTKLIIQIPCYNEEKTLPTTLNDLPNISELGGINELDVIVINDGSTDKTAEIAREWGAKVVNINSNKGLANAFRVGLQKSLESGADIIVNTDADNQYCAKDINKLIQPILNKEADIVIGARDINNINDFSFIKKILQKLGSSVLRLLSSTQVQDAPSGFRAFSGEAALRLNVFDNYTYTMETLVQASAKGLKTVSVPIRTNHSLRKSRLVTNILSYIFKSMKTTIRMFIVYRPFRFFFSISLLTGILGIILVARFLYYYCCTSSGNGHIQSLIFAAILLISSVQMAIIAVLGDLLSINRRLLEDIQTRIKTYEIDKF